MKRRIFTICLVLGFLALALLFLTAKPMRAVKAQALTATPTLTGLSAEFTGSPLQSDSAPLMVYFTAPGSVGVKCTWTWGDGGSYTPEGICGSATITHLYRNPGSYTVSLHVEGAPNDVIKTDYIVVLNGPTKTATCACFATPTPTRTPTPGPSLTRTRTPTNGPTVTRTRTPTTGPSLTVTHTPSPVRYVTGHVRVGSSTGPGLANVNVCYYLASYTFDCATNTVLTDANGYYQLSICTPGQENVTVQASLSGYTLSPASYQRIWYGGCMPATYDFVATAGGTGTPTPATPTKTPTTGPTLCTPISTIAAPFTFDGAGTLCWQSNNLGSSINSWNATKVTLNFLDITNIYVPSSSYPPQINGYWYISYTSTVAYAHFETK